MKIVGKSGNRYLILTDGNIEDKRAMGRVLDLNNNELLPEIYLHSILLRGYWEEYDAEDGELQELLEQIGYEGEK